MFETIGKTILWTFLLIGMPIILLALIFTLGAIAPVVGIIMLLFLPAIIIGIVIGRKSTDKDKGAE